MPSGSVPVCASLGDADGVARRVAERAIALSPALVDRLLQYLRAGCPHLLEEGVEIVRGEYQEGQRALDQQLLKSVALGLGTAGVRHGEHVIRPRLPGSPETEPAVLAIGDVIEHLEPERVAVEAE